MKRGKRILTVVVTLLMGLTISSCGKNHSPDNQSTRLLLRCDDIGMNHSVNMAAQKVIDAGVPFSASLMTTTPWFEEAVGIVKDQKNVSLGIHLTLNSEWQGYRWGPIIGEDASSLVDEHGYFFPTTQQFLDHNPKKGEIEKELRAQIERALSYGLKIDYLDYHMGTAVSRPEYRKIVEKLAKDYDLGISQYFGEDASYSIYSAAPEVKTDSLVAKLGELNPGNIYLMVFHIGMDTPEMEALKDFNPNGLPNVAKHRAAERAAITSRVFRRAVSQKNIQLWTYKHLINDVGLDQMKYPGNFGY